MPRPRCLTGCHTLPVWFIACSSHTEAGTPLSWQVGNRHKQWATPSAQLRAGELAGMQDQQAPSCKAGAPLCRFRLQTFDPTPPAHLCEHPALLHGTAWQTQTQTSPNEADARITRERLPKQKQCRNETDPMGHGAALQLLAKQRWLKSVFFLRP